MIFDVWE